MTLPRTRTWRRPLPPSSPQTSSSTASSASGSSPGLREPAISLVAAIPYATPVLAVDLPSGMDPDAATLDSPTPISPTPCPPRPRDRHRHVHFSQALPPPPPGRARRWPHRRRRRRHPGSGPPPGGSPPNNPRSRPDSMAGPGPRRRQVLPRRRRRDRGIGSLPRRRGAHLLVRRPGGGWHGPIPRSPPGAGPRARRPPRGGRGGSLDHRPTALPRVDAWVLGPGVADDSTQVEAIKAALASGPSRRCRCRCDRGLRPRARVQAPGRPRPIASS